MCVCAFSLSATPFSLSSPNRDGKVFSFSTLQDRRRRRWWRHGYNKLSGGDLRLALSNECVILRFIYTTYALPPRAKMTFNFHVFHCECFVKVKSSGRWTFFLFLSCRLLCSSFTSLLPWAYSSFIVIVVFLFCRFFVTHHNFLGAWAT